MRKLQLKWKSVPSKRNGSTVVDRANEKPLNLTIPMIGNISIHHANSKNTNSDLSTSNPSKKLFNSTVDFRN